MEVHLAYRYLVIGAGTVGPAIAWKILSEADTELVTLADVDGDRAQKALCNLLRIAPNASSKCRSIMLDARNEASVLKVFYAHDMVISALPAQYNPVLASHAISTGASFCDLGGVVRITKEMMQLDTRAELAGVSIVPDCGLMPGMGMVLARALMEEFDETDTVRIYVGGMPQRPVPPHNYLRVFNLEGLQEICAPAETLERGVLVTKDPFADYERMYIPELARFATPFNGHVEAFLTAGASIAPETFAAQNVKYFCEKTVRWPGFVKFVRHIPSGAFVETFASHVPSVSAENPDFVFMRVEAYGILHGMSRQASMTCIDAFDVSTGFSAMARTTGFATALMAARIARGYVRKGAATPEWALSLSGLRTHVEDLEDCFRINKTVTA